MIITLLRKPLDGSVAENALQHGCGALNIDATRIASDDESYFKNWNRNQSEKQGIISEGWQPIDLRGYAPKSGRWPANLILVHHPNCSETCCLECPCVALDAMSASTNPICVVEGEVPKSKLASHFFLSVGNEGNEQ